MGFKYLATVGFIGTVIGYCLFRRNSKSGHLISYLNNSVLLTDRGWLTNKPLHFLCLLANLYQRPDYQITDDLLKQDAGCPAMDGTLLPPSIYW